jgi:hypothetical protein
MPSKALLSMLLLSGATIALPAYAIDDHFTVRLGAAWLDADNEVSGRTQFNGEDFEFKEDFDFGDQELVPRLDGQFHFSERNRIVFNYFSYDKDQRATLGEDLSFDDITIPAGSFAQAETDFRSASLLYDFAVVETPTTSFGLQLGAQYAKLEGRLLAESGADRYDKRATEDGYAPVAGARLTVAPNAHWRFEVQGQYLDADWGNFGDYEGSLGRASATVEYRFTPSFGVFAGYDWFRLDVEREGGDGVIGLDQRFRGPTAGVTFAF